MFTDNLEREMARTGILSLKEVDIVLVPIIWSDHFVAVAFNLLTGVIDLLYNSANQEIPAYATFKSVEDESKAIRENFEERYGKTPDILVNIHTCYKNCQNT